MNVIASPTLPWSPAPRPGVDPAERMAWYADVARWAPSKHNTQPWHFVVRGSSLEVWADPQRLLAETDPQRRELVISCGAAVHLAGVAARAAGFQPRVTLQPDGPAGPLARLVEAGRWQTREQDQKLLEAIASRRTDRGPLDAQVLPSSLPFLLQAAAAEEGASLRLVSTGGDRATFARLVERADRILVQGGGVDHELAPWLRDAGDPRPDGVPTEHTRGAAASYRAEFVQRDFSSERSVPSQNRPGADRPIVGVLCTGSDRERDWLVAGQALGAVLLCAAAAGASASYLNQPVEVPAMRTELRSMLGLTGEAQLVLRLGAGGPVPPTPRRKHAEVTLRADGPGA